MKRWAKHPACQLDRFQESQAGSLHHPPPQILSRHFFNWYNNDHYHSGIGLVTPASLQGTSGFESVIRATDQLIDAELELAENAKGRIIILQRRVELMKSLFSMVEMRLKVGQVTKAHVLAAQAALLETTNVIVAGRAQEETMAGSGSFSEKRKREHRR